LTWPQTKNTAEILTSVEKTAGCVHSFVRILLADIGVGVPPDLEEMGKIVKISTNVERDQVSVKMEYVETSRELISATVTLDM